MGNYCVNVFLDEAQEKRIQEAGLGDQIIQVEGKKAVKVPIGDKEHKKLLKAFPDLQFDSSDACVLPDPATKALMDIITTSKTVDCMKVAIIKLYNPLAGKELRSKVL
ncbi:MAG: hypothetical protein NTY44_13310 [Deltaproteobacteria bacterium]|jgi:hypothetical protein|nr:hypothetical protein [Deltaproteobacteria bacterium]